MYAIENTVITLADWYGINLNSPTPRLTTLI